jgi:Protein of unknown function (DUF2800)
MSELISEEKKHARLGGSSAARWISCPGSVALSETQPEQEAGEPARIGTMAHTLAELALTEWLDHRLEGTPPDEKFEARCAVYPPDIDEDKWDEICQMARDWRDTIWKEVMDSTITGKIFGFEDYVTFDETLDAGGSIDFWVVYRDDKGKRVLVICDFKSGYKVVDAKHNYQLLFYAAAMREEMLRMGKDIDYCRTAIFQPKAQFPYSEHTYTVAQLEAFKVKAYKAAHAVYYSKKPKLKTGDYCTFCRAQAVCPKYTKEIQQKTGLKLIDPEHTPLPTVDLLTPEQISRILNKADELTDLIKACKLHAKQQYVKGDPIPGWKLIEGKGKRGWRKEQMDDIVTTLKKKLGESGIKVVNEKPVALGTLEKELKKAGYEPKQIEKFLKPFISVSSPPPKLVPESDKTPGIQNTRDLLLESDLEIEE